MQATLSLYASHGLNDVNIFPWLVTWILLLLRKLVELFLIFGLCFWNNDFCFLPQEAVGGPYMI